MLLQYNTRGLSSFEIIASWFVQTHVLIDSVQVELWGQTSSRPGQRS